MVQVSLAVNKPVTTEDPDITVINPLPIGVHRLRLVVEDSLGDQSAPFEAQITIVRGTVTPVNPVTPVTPVRPVNPVDPLTPVRPVRPIT
jgi:hypothetical protein